MSIDYYKILGVSRSANEARIKLAYRVLIQHAHPDRGGDREAFEQISEAYAVLSDPISRADYDKYGNVDPLLVEAIEKLQTHMVGIISNTTTGTDNYAFFVHGSRSSCVKRWSFAKSCLSRLLTTLFISRA